MKVVFTNSYPLFRFKISCLGDDPKFSSCISAHWLWEPCGPKLWISMSKWQWIKWDFEDFFDILTQKGNERRTYLFVKKCKKQP